MALHPATRTEIASRARRYVIETVDPEVALDDLYDIVSGRLSEQRIDDGDALVLADEIVSGLIGDGFLQ